MRTFVQHRRDRKLARSLTWVLKCFMCVTEKQTLLSIGCLQTRHNRVVWRRTYLLKTLVSSYNNNDYYCYYHYYYYWYYYYCYHYYYYADVNGFLNPSIITGENYRPDNNNNNCLFTNPNRKSEKEIKEVIPF